MNLRSLHALVPLVAACSATPRSQPGSAPAPVNAPTSVAASPHTAAGEPGSDAKRSPPSARQGRGSALSLPADEAFVGAPLPAPRPERYRSFGLSSKIMVGRSHLQEVDLFPGETWLLAVSDDEATVRVYERTPARLAGNYPVAGFRRFETGGVVAWPEGAPRFVVASVEGLFVYDARTGDLVDTPSRERFIRARWSPDRRILVAEASEAQGPSRLHFLARAKATGKTGTLASLGVLEFPERVDAWDLSADNRLLATAHYPSGSLVVRDLRDGTEVARVPGPEYGGDVAFSPDGRLIAMGGQGLLLVDLSNPARRAYYSHFDNNVGHVRFSPSGDAVVASSYDGRLRIFTWDMTRSEGRITLKLSLAQTLRHEGQANVYAFVFEQDGDGLVSVSGDQTIRTFREQKSRATASAAEAAPRTFHTLADWARLDPDAARPLPPAPEPALRNGLYRPPLLDGAPRPSSIRPGRYACKIDRMYKLRDCTVRKDEKGHTLLKFGEGNLVEPEGVLYDDGPVVRFEGWQVPGTLVAGCRGCEKQPLHIVFRGGPKRYEGLLKFRNYYDPYTPPEPPAADEKIEASGDRFPVVLEYRGP